MQTIEFRKLTPIKAKSEISEFILKERKKGKKTLSVLDVVLSLKIPACQVENVFDKFIEEKKIKEVNG